MLLLLVDWELCYNLYRIPFGTYVAIADIQLRDFV